MSKNQIDELSKMSAEEQNQYIESVAFVYLSFCIADGQHEQEELGSVYEALSKWHGIDMDTFQLFLKNFNEVFNQGENIFQEELNKNISFVINDLKKIDAGSDRKDLQVFLKNLVIIAQADGVIAEPEKRWIQNFCNALDVDYPKEILDNSDKQRPKIIELLADQGGGLKEAKEIIDNDKSQVNATDILMHTHGFTPLHYACWDGKDDLVEYLIEQGANVDAEGTYDTCTPLLLCIEPHQYNCAKLLIEADANLEIRNTEEPPNPFHAPKFATILRLAVMNTSYDLAELLIKKGASVDVLFEPCIAKDYDSDSFFENCIGVGKQYYSQTYDLERLNKIIEQVSNGKSTEEPEEVEEEEKKTGPMALSHKTKSDEENQFLSDFIVKWMAETEDYAYAMSKIQFPSFLKEIDDACPVFTDEEITFINYQIDYEKCIPSLPYIHEPTFYNHSKQVWWVAPCVYWGEKLVSWVMVDKNGFYAPHPENWDDQDDVSAIFSWEMVEDISFDINEFEDHAIATLNIEATNGGELTFYEFLSLNEEVSKAEKEAIFRGSYLSVFKSIFDVNYENIIQSRGSHSWNHGVGMEGFKAFKDPSELLKQSIWEEARTDRMNYKTNSIFDYNPDLVELAKSSDPKDLTKILRDKNSTESVINIICSNEDIDWDSNEGRELEKLLAAHPNLPVEQFEITYENSEDRDLKSLVLDNPNCPIDLKIKIVKDPNCESDVIDRIVMDDNIPWGTQEAELLKDAVASNPNTSSPQLQNLYENAANDHQKSLILKNPNCPEKLKQTGSKGASKSKSKTTDTGEAQTEENLTLQGQLAERFTSIYSAAVVKKIDDGNYLDIHLPNIHNRKGTHIWFNTPKSGGIKIGFYCRDKEFVETAVDASSDTIETYSSGLRPKGAPVFDNIDDAIEAVQSFIEDLPKKLK